MKILDNPKKSLSFMFSVRQKRYYVESRLTTPGVRGRRIKQKRKKRENKTHGHGQQGGDCGGEGVGGGR